MLATGDVPVSYGTLADGFQGTDQTVALMGRMAMGRYGAASPKIRALALNILESRRVPEKDYDAEARAIGEWVRDSITYRRDVHGQETLSHPEETAFNTRAGDCDDKSILLAALLGAAGVPTRFKVIGVTPHQYSHVYLQAKPRNAWITMDPIMKDKPIGWEVPATKRAIEKTYDTNLPAGGSMNGLNGLGMMSPLEADPPPMAAKPAYVSMPSNLDTDADITPLMYYRPNQNAPAQYPQQRADWRGPQLQYLTNQGLRNQPVLRPDAPLPPRAADEGRFEVLTPDRMQGIGLDLDQAQPAQAYPNMRPVLTKPEGVDLQFVRAAQVFDPNQDDKIAFQGTPDLQQRPPIKPLTSLQGMDPSMLPGMGVIYGAGPGLADGATGNEVPGQAHQGGTVTVPASAPNYGRLLMIGVAVAGGLYLLKRRKRARR